MFASNKSPRYNYIEHISDRAHEISQKEFNFSPPSTPTTNIFMRPPKVTQLFSYKQQARPQIKP